MKNVSVRPSVRLNVRNLISGERWTDEQASIRLTTLYANAVSLLIQKPYAS